MLPFSCFALTQRTSLFVLFLSLTFTFKSHAEKIEREANDWEIVQESDYAISNNSTFNYNLFQKETWLDGLDQKVLNNPEYNELKTFVRGPEELHSIRSRYIYVPFNATHDTKPVVVVVMHGTFAQKSKNYYDPRQLFFGEALSFASQYARSHACPTEVISFRWSGRNASKDRIDAGAYLARLLNVCYAGYTIITIGHSHGCNVINFASQQLMYPYICFDTMIHLAAPVRDTHEEIFRPAHFKKLVNFYSTGDIVAAVGALTQWNFYKNDGSTHKYTCPIVDQYQGLASVGALYNVRVQVNASDPSHSSIKTIIKFLPEALQGIFDYQYNRDLDLNISEKAPNNNVLVGIRHYASSNKSPLKEVIQETIRSCGPDAAIVIADQIAQEYTDSERQKAVFKAIYKKNMGDKGGLFARAWRNVSNLWA